MEYKENIQQFKNALSTMSVIWLIVNGLGALGVIGRFLSGNPNHDDNWLLLIMGTFMIFFAEMFRRIVIGTGWVLLSINSKINPDSDTPTF